MGFEEKVDVIDLIINVLKEHEKTLDELISKIEGALEGTDSLRAPVTQTGVRRPVISVVLSRWMEFRERCARADIATYDIENGIFSIYAVKEGVLYSYQEQMPDMDIKFKENDEKTIIQSIELLSTDMVFPALRGRLECGLEVTTKGTEVTLPNGSAVYKVRYEIDAYTVKEWLSNQLGIEREDILQGKIQI